MSPEQRQRILDARARLRMLTSGQDWTMAQVDRRTLDATAEAAREFAKAIEESK